MTSTRCFLRRRLDISRTLRQLSYDKSNSETLELGVKNLVSGKLEETKVLFAKNQSDPVSQSLQSNVCMLSGDYLSAERLSREALQYFKRTGVVSDSYMDFAGVLNDLAVISFEMKDSENADRQLRRALLMAERSHRISFDLQSSILANLVSVNSSRFSKAEEINEKLLDLLKSSGTLFPQETISSHLSPSSSSSFSSAGKEFFYAMSVLPTLRRCQVYLTVGTVLGLSSNKFAYGITYINKALELLSNLPSDVASFQCKGFLLQLASFQDICMLRTGSYVPTHHLQQDGLELLCKTISVRSTSDPGPMCIFSAKPSMLRDLGNNTRTYVADQKYADFTLNPAPAIGILLSCPDWYYETNLYLSGKL